MNSPTKFRFRTTVIAAAIGVGCLSGSTVAAAESLSLNSECYTPRLKQSVDIKWKAETSPKGRYQVTNDGIATGNPFSGSIEQITDSFASPILTTANIGSTHTVALTTEADTNSIFASANYTLARAGASIRKAKLGRKFTVTVNGLNANKQIEGRVYLDRGSYNKVLGTYDLGKASGACRSVTKKFKLPKKILAGAPKLRLSIGPADVAGTGDIEYYDKDYTIKIKTK